MASGHTAARQLHTPRGQQRTLATRAFTARSRSLRVHAYFAMKATFQAETLRRDTLRFRPPAAIAASRRAIFADGDARHDAASLYTYDIITKKALLQWRCRRCGRRSKHVDYFAGKRWLHAHAARRLATPMKPHDATCGMTCRRKAHTIRRSRERDIDATTHARWFTREYAQAPQAADSISRYFSPHDGSRYFRRAGRKTRRETDAHFARKEPMMADLTAILYFQQRAHDAMARCYRVCRHWACFARVAIEGARPFDYAAACAIAMIVAA